MKFKVCLVFLVLSILYFSFSPGDDFEVKSLIDGINQDSNRVEIQIKSISDFLQLEWAVPFEWERGFPFQQDGLLFPTYCPQYAIDGNTGKKLYYHHIKNQKLFQKNCRDSVFVFSKYDRILVMDIYEGNILFETKRKCKFPVRKEPRVIHDSVLYYVTDHKTLEAFDFRNNIVLWSINSETFIDENVIKNNNTIFFGDEDFLYGIDPKNAEIKLKVDMGRFMSKPLITDNLFYVIVDNKGLVCFDMDNMETKWIFDDMDIEFSKQIKLVFSDSNVYFLNGGLYAVNSENGILLWGNNEIMTGYPTSIIMCKDVIVCYHENEFILSVKGCDKLNGGIVYELNKGIAEGKRTDLAFEQNIFSFANNLFNNNLYAVGWDSIYCFKIIDVE